MGLYVEDDGRYLAVLYRCSVVVTGGVRELEYDFFAVIAVDCHTTETLRAVVRIGALEEWINVIVTSQYLERKIQLAQQSVRSVNQDRVVTFTEAAFWICPTN